MSLQAKWLPLERGVDFYIEMLKRLGPKPTPQTGVPPPGQFQKTLKIHIDFWNDFTSFCASRMELKKTKLDKTRRRFRICFWYRFLMDLWIDFGNPGSLK